MIRTRWAETFLRYAFQDPALLEQALTHRSASGKNNERLEFLGDAFLNLIIAAELYRLRESDAEGDLSRARAALVNKRSLSALAREIKIDTQLILGPGEAGTGGSQRDSIVADALEAVIGAVYLDSDHETARTFVVRLFESRLAELPPAEALKDPKTRLQEWLQARGMGLPTYRLESTSGPEHRRKFTVVCELASGDAASQGTGWSKRQAEQSAAAVMLAELTSD